MERHDPLSTLSPVEPAQETPKETRRPKRQRKQPLLLRELADVKNESLAFLYGGPRQQKGDYERNLAQADEIRREFAAFCESHPHFSNWRQAWAAFMAQRPRETVLPPPGNVIPLPVARPAGLPGWRQRMKAIACLYGT